MFDIICFFGQDCVSVVVEPIVETANVLFWNLWTCSDLRMLEDKLIYSVGVNLCLQGQRQMNKPAPACCWSLSIDFAHQTATEKDQY